MHLIGVSYSSDVSWTLKELRVKLPILIIPFMFVGFPKLDYSKFEKIVYFYATVIGLVSIIILATKLIGEMEIKYLMNEYFLSHIRYSLNLNIAMYFLAIVHLRKKRNHYSNLLVAILLLWLVFFLFYLKSFTGIVVFIVLFFVIGLFLAFRTKKLTFKIVYLSSLLLILFSLSFYFGLLIKNYYEVEEIQVESLEKYTKSGNKYKHELPDVIESGQRTYFYVCNKELNETWNNLSDISYDSIDGNGHLIKYTLIRYLSSKGLRKDKEGVESLSKKDISNIEKGIANYQYTQGVGISSRIKEILFEYDNYLRTRNPSGHSVMQRIEFWRTAKNIIKKNFWIGVGMGDLKIAFDTEYVLMGTKLNEKYRLRSHNQYLSIWAAFGLLGLVWFLFALLYPPIKHKLFGNIYFLVFFTSFAMSMFTEDTIETQAGVTFFIVFYCLFLFTFTDNKKNLFPTY